jgi:hypothetical protein
MLLHRAMARGLVIFVSRGCQRWQFMEPLFVSGEVALIAVRVIALCTLPEAIIARQHAITL